MEVGAITEHIDVAQVALYLFWLFFAGLIFYLQREARREGYPLVSERSGGYVQEIDGIFMPAPKTYNTLDGRTVLAPDPARADSRPLAARQLAGGAGSPYVPTGDPLADCIGPSSYAERPDIPDITFEKKPRIVPMRIASDFTIAERDPDPRGMTVIGSDGATAGTVVEVWVDRSEFIARYLEVELATAGAATAQSEGAEGSATASARRVLLPVPFADFDKANRRVLVHALLGSQFAGVPILRSPDQITLLEEEKVAAYYGGGLLYATPDRQEPLV